MYPHPCFHIALRQPPIFHAPSIGRARGRIPHVRQRTGHDCQRRHLRGTHRPHPRVGVDGHRLASGEIEVVRFGTYNAATFFSSFLMARLMKSFIVVPEEATNAATRECNSDDMRRFNLPL